MGLTNRIEEIISEHGDLSGVILVKQGDNIIYKNALGYAHRGFEVENNMDTRFDTASITKLFTTVSILQLIDEGKISFDTSVMDYIGLRGTKISPEVNIFHLLTHTSGIADDADEEEGENYEDIWKTKPNYMVRETIDFLPQFIHKPAKYSPGEKCSYNNVGFVLLGLVIERASGRTYREYVGENIFKRAGMKDTEFCSMDGVYKNVAEGYSPIRDDNEEIIEYKKNIYSYPPVGSPDAGAFVTAGDLDVFIRSLREGRLLSEKLTEDIFKPKVDYVQRKDYMEMMGYGFQFLIDENNKTVYMHKDGSNAGVSNSFSYYPELDTTLILLSNNQYNVWGIRRQIHEEIGK